MSRPEPFRRILEAERLYNQFMAAQPKRHPKLEENDQKLASFIRMNAPGSLAVVFGPTGVGKSTLLAGIVRHSMRRARLSAIDRPDHLPCFGIELIAPDGGRYNWRDTWVRLIDAGVDPVPNVRRRVNGRTLKRDSDGQLVLAERWSAPELRRVYEGLVQIRRPDHVYLDEAHHLTILPVGTNVEQQLEVFKSIANLTRTPHILYGGYGLLDFYGWNAQAQRRFLYLHFPRYRRTGDDRLHFRAVIHAFQSQLPIRCVDLLEIADYLHECSDGRVGVLKEWLGRALYDTIRDGGNMIERPNLEKAELLDLASLQQEGDDGEERWALLSKAALPSLIKNREAQAPATPEATRSKSKRPGRPRPRRYPMEAAGTKPAGGNGNG